MPCRQTAVIYCLSHRFVNLGGDHRVVTSARVLGQPLTQNSLSGTDTGVATVAIGQSHHVACLAAYLKAVTDEGMAAIIASSSPATASVAPFGAVEGIYSPNPLAAGWPTGGEETARR